MPEGSKTLPEDWSQSLWQKNNTTRAPLNWARSSRTLSRRWKSAEKTTTGNNNIEVTSSPYTTYKITYSAYVTGQN